MDYEKAYKEALERARELAAKWTGKNKDFYIGDYSYIFPELRESESEDEKIRKALILHLQAFYSNEVVAPGISKEMAIAYLEKQEQKPAWSEEDEEMWMDIKSHMIHGSFIPFDKIEWIENRLKSLRPSWKPSEEHLSALLAVFNDPDNIGSQTCQLALTDLYEQLKKL